MIQHKRYTELQVGDRILEQNAFGLPAEPATVVRPLKVEPRGRNPRIYIRFDNEPDKHSLVRLPIEDAEALVPLAN